MKPVLSGRVAQTILISFFCGCWWSTAAANDSEIRVGYIFNSEGTTFNFGRDRLDGRGGSVQTSIGVFNRLFFLGEYADRSYDGFGSFGATNQRLGLGYYLTQAPTPVHFWLGVAHERWSAEESTSRKRTDSGYGARAGLEIPISAIEFRLESGYIELDNGHGMDSSASFFIPFNEVFGVAIGYRMLDVDVTAEFFEYRIDIREASIAATISF